MNGDRHVKPIVLFLCSGNSARSQMAEALLRKHAGDRFEIHSAGLEPRGIHPFTRVVMDEVGIGLDEHRSKSVEEFLGNASVRVAIFVCSRAENECPKVWPFALQQLSWPFDDPAVYDDEESGLQRFRSIRDEIDVRIREWVAQMQE